MTKLEENKRMKPLVLVMKMKIIPMEQLPKTRKKHYKKYWQLIQYSLDDLEMVQRKENNKWCA